MLKRVYIFMHRKAIDAAIKARKAGNEELAGKYTELANWWASKIRE